MSEPLLSVRDLKVAFGTKKDQKEVIHGVDLDVYPGETVAIVGESGSGKSTTMHAVMNLLPGTGKITGGSIKWGGRELVGIGRRDMETIRAREIGLVPQDPMSNLNPVWSIGFQVEEAIRANGVAKGRKEVKARAIEVLQQAGLQDAERRMRQYPHQFSGGMKQRVVIAIAMICNPELIICDEPTTALDVTIQAQIMELLKGLQNNEGKSIVLITHNMGLVAEMADEVCVMYMGRVVEFGSLEDIFDHPSHPYTQALLRSVPVLGLADGQKLETIPGITPNPSELKEGCDFANRCPECREECKKGRIASYEVSEGHRVRCLLYNTFTEVDES